MNPNQDAVEQVAKVRMTETQAAVQQPRRPSAPAQVAGGRRPLTGSRGPRPVTTAEVHAGRQMWRVCAVMGVLLVALVTLQPPAARAQMIDPEVVMDAWIAVPVDLEAKLQLVVDTVTIRIDSAPSGASGVWTGTDAAHTYLAFSKRHVLSSQLVGRWNVGGNRVSGTVLLRTRSFETWGVGPVKHLYTAGLERGKIAWFTATVAPSERPRLAAARVAARQGVSRLTTPLGRAPTPKGWISTGTFPEYVMH